LCGSRALESAPPRRDLRNLQVDQRRRTAEEVGWFPQRRDFRVGGTSVAEYRRTSAAAAQPESPAVDGRRRPPVDQEYWFRRMDRTLGGQPDGRQLAVDVDRGMPETTRRDTKRNYAQKVGTL